MVQPDTTHRCLNNKIYFPCLIAKAIIQTHTHSEYVILLTVPWQKWLCESVTTLRYTYIHSLSRSILLCLLAFLFSGTQRTESDSPPYRIPLHNDLSPLSPLTSCSNHVPSSSDVSKELAISLSRHNVTVNNVHYVMSHAYRRVSNVPHNLLSR